MFVQRVSELFAPTKGNRTGKCVVCGYPTEHGHPLDFSDNFTSWSLLEQGDCICEYCYSLVRKQEYRRKSWIATLNGVRFLQRTEILPTMCNPPDPPFAMYITKSGKKQGFLHLINRVNYSKDRYVIAFDNEQIWVNLATLCEMVDIAKQARKLGFSKSDLRKPSVKRWEHRELCQKIERFSKNPLWEVVVYAIP
jgi:CRISPR type IV-associated protein Csf1